MSEELEIGPVDVVVIGYPAGAPRTGKGLAAVLDLVDRGVIRVLDVLLIEKTADGAVAGVEIADLDGDGVDDLVVFAGARSGLLGDEDAAVAGEALEPGGSALLLAFENAWAAPFVAAVRANGGELLGFERVAADDLLEAVALLDAADAA